MTVDTVDHVFVYGTLQDGFSNPGRDILTTHARYVGPARVEGALYDLGSFPALVVDVEDPGTVTGEVYELTADPRTALERLDRYEGAAGDTPGPYRREVLTIELEDGSTLPAFTYVWTEPVDASDRVRSGDYTAYLLDR